VVTIRKAMTGDAEALQGLAEAFATSFQVRSDTVARTLPDLVARGEACILVAEEQRIVAYLLGFVHPTFYANGLVGWVEEVMVDPSWRRKGVGRDLMSHFERWVSSQGGTLVALATRRAAEFYRAIGYEESAVYHRKVLGETAVCEPGTSRPQQQ
jgi:GNAT superfamily N-acetyltransferase